MVGEAYVEISRKSYFCRDVDGVSEVLADLPANLQRWARAVSSTSIEEHFERVDEFVSYSRSIGIDLNNTVLEAFRARTKILTGSSSYDSDGFDPKVGLLDPVRNPTTYKIVVHSEVAQVAERCISQMGQAGSRLLGSKSFIENWCSTGLAISSFTDDYFHLIIVPDSADFAQDLKWQRLFYSLEKRGLIFKIVHESSSTDRFVCRNIIFDLFQKAGGVPWVPTFNDPRLICAVDAGHHTGLELSRWTACRFSKEKLRQRTYFEDVQLAEHMPASVCSKLLTKLTNSNSLVLRDGRSHKSDRNYFVEAAVIYEESDCGISAVKPGTYFRYPDGSVLLQSAINPHNKDYVRPLRISSLKPLSDEVVIDMQGLVLLPPTTMTHSIRLPFPLYWADLASKLNGSDWAKVLGNGWSLERLVPELRKAQG